MTTTAANPPIVIPALLEGYSAKLVDPKPQDDADFITGKGKPVDVVITDHAIMEGGKGTMSVRLQLVVVSGTDGDSVDVTGRSAVTDKWLTQNAMLNTLADLRLYGLKVPEGKTDDEILEKTLALIDSGDPAKSGLGAKVLRMTTKTDSFNNVDRIVVGDLSQPPQKVSAAAVKAKFGAGLAAALKKSAEGREKFGAKGGTGGNAAGGGRDAAKNPTSPPPAAVDKTEDMDF